MKLLRNIDGYVLFVFLSFCLSSQIYAQTTNFSPKNAVSGEVASDQDSDSKALDAEHENVKNALEEKKEEVTKVKKEAEKVVEEKKTIEKEAQAKEEAAALAEKEAQLLRKEAQVTKDPALLKKAKELETDAEKLKKEATLAKEKLVLAESKAKAAQTTISVHQQQIEKLKKELEAIRSEKVSRRPWHEKIIRAAGAILGGLLLFFLLTLALRRFERLITKKDAIREDALTLRMKTLIKLLRWLGNIIIVALVIYMVLDNFGFNMAPLLAGAGIVGLAFGFGGQYLIRDLINGLFILIEDQYRVNDVVKINEYGGLVEDINLRITTMRDLEGRVIIIPNGEIKIVVNYTKEYAQALFDIGVAYKENVDRVMDVIRQVGKEMRQDPYFGRLILADLEMFGVDDFGSSQVTIKFRIKTLPIKQWEVAREFRRRLKNRFDELGIEIPFPHTTLYWGAGTDNDWLRAFAEKMSRGK
jgi:small conductance mechanosensitive channel